MQEICLNPAFPIQLCIFPYCFLPLESDESSSYLELMWKTVEIWAMASKEVDGLIACCGRQLSQLSKRFCVVNLIKFSKNYSFVRKKSRSFCPWSGTLLLTLVCLRLYTYSTCVCILLFAWSCGCFCLHGSTTVIRSYRDRLRVFLFAGCWG